MRKSRAAHRKFIPEITAAVKRSRKIHAGITGKHPRDINNDLSVFITSAVSGGAYWR